MSSSRPCQFPRASGHPTEGPAASPALASTDVAAHVPAAAPRTVMSARVAGVDGTVVATVFRHDEYLPTRGTLAVVGVAGDVDQDSVPLLHNALTSAIDSNPRVCCDLSEVTFFGASGVNTLLSAHWHATTAGRHFTVRGVHGLTRRVFDITGLDQVLTVAA